MGCRGFTEEYSVAEAQSMDAPIPRNPEPIPTRVELMERIEAAWAELDHALVDLDAHQLAAKPSPPAGEGEAWSIKDHLAHLAVWMRSAAAIVSGKNRPEAMGIDCSVWERGGEEEINAAIQQHWGDRSPADVLAALRTAQAELRELVGAMEDEDLARPYSHFQPETPPYQSDPVVGWIAGNTFEHVAGHLPAIRAAREQVI
jgi:hypothetical protein